MSRSIALVWLSLLPCACGTDSAPGEAPDAGQGGGDASADADVEEQEHSLMPAVAHSGFDGTSTYKVPVYTTLEEAVFEMEDEAIASVEPLELPPELAELETFGKSWAMITTVQPGTSAFSARAGDIRLEATLIVAEYDPEVVAVGAQRYSEPVDPDESTRKPCQDCHGGPDGVDHTPLALSYFEDDEILVMIAEGMYPDGGQVNAGNHQWNLTEAEAAGIVPYLRSLQPQGF